MSENPNDPSPYSPPPPPPESHVSGVSAEQRQWAMFAHLSAIAGAVLTSGVGGWGTFLGPLIIWLIKKDTMPFVEDQAKEALNYNITVGDRVLRAVGAGVHHPGHRLPDRDSGLGRGRRRLAGASRSSRR